MLSENQKLPQSDSSQPIVSIRGVTKEYYPGKGIVIPALNSVDLDIAAGEFIAITGHSGSGKSTLLNLIGLIDTLTAGEIHINNHGIHTFSEAERVEFRLRFISIVFQFFNLIDNYTALENISFQLRLQGYSKEEATRKAMETLVFLGLENRANLFPKELSGGEQQRIAIGRAIAKDSMILLADEPTAHLDSNNSEHILSLLHHVNQTLGKTIILVTHEESEAERASKNIVMRDGKIIDILT